jgi:LysM repeat protein
MERGRSWRRVWAVILALCLWLAAGEPALALEDSPPESAYISGVPAHAQTYTLSCEARSAADWAAFWGVSIDESQFLASLPRSDDPDAGFVGYPNDPWGYVPPSSYGVHAGPVAALLREYGVRARAQHGLKWRLLKEEIAAGRPVIVWIIGQMWAGTPVAYSASDGNTTRVARFEHTMILIGYDASVVHVVDAYSGWTQTYPLEAFLSSWGVLGNMAILGRGKPPSRHVAAGGKTYVVQRGEYLIQLAERFNVSWQELAELNNISYPYTLYAGQELKLPGQELKLPGQVAPTPTPKRPKKTPKPPEDKESSPYIVLLPFAPHLGASKIPGKPARTPVPGEGGPKTYTVQRGDFLVALAERFGMDWRLLADLNGISYPYVIYPGQVLKLDQ